MAIIQSGATSDLLTIDPTSKAARTTLYRSDGSEIETVFAGEYYLSFTQRFTVALAANSGIFAMRNGATKTIRFLEMQMGLTFDGTAAASTMQIVGMKMNSATATPSGGTALGGATGLLGSPAFAVVPESAGAAATTLADARYAAAGTALTTTGIVTTSPVFSFSVPRGATGGTSFINWPRDLELAPNEGLVLSYASAGVIGDGITFTCYWGEF